MSGGIPGGGEWEGDWDTVGDGGNKGCQVSAEGVRQISGGEGVEGVSRTTPRVKMKIDIIVTKENKILTHGLNEKNPTTMYYYA